MRLRLVLAVFLLVSRVTSAAPVTLDFDSVALRDFAKTVYLHVLNKSAVFDSELLEDSSVVSLSLRNIDEAQAEREVKRLLERHGYSVGVFDGVIRVDKSRDDEGEIFVYRPLHREVRYLLDALSGFFGTVAASSPSAGYSSGLVQRRGSGVNVADLTGRAGVAASDKGATGLADRDTDVLVFRGSGLEVKRLKMVLAQLDVPWPEVLVKAVVYEVRTDRAEGSAVDLALSILKGKLGLDLVLGGGPATDSGPYVKFSGGGIDLSAVYRALDSDDRFRVTTSPRVRVRSGSSARFSVGNETPVLGAISYDATGRATQSVSYKPSGVIFEVRPVVRAQGAQLSVMQQVSQFAATSNGVNGSPTLIKRELATDINAVDGELILIGGLDELRSTGTDVGLPFLPQWMRSYTSQDLKTELVLMMQVQRI
jgi:type II secretory pathway component GspD/PulD (secretin)